MSKKTNVTTNEAQEPKTYTFRFTIKVLSIRESEVTDNETGKVYKCKNEWYERNGDKKFYVNVSTVETRSMKDKFSFPWSAKILENGKLRGTNPIGMIHETNLAGKQAAMITEDMFV